MKTIFLLCVAFALSIAAVPVEEVAAAPETHLDVEQPVQMLDRTEEKKQLPEEEVGEKMLGDVKRSSCPSDWSKYGSRCFKFIHREMSWVDAEKHCLCKGANLASVHNPGEFEFIQEVVNGSTGCYPQVWIGGTDAVKDNVWLWSDGSGFNFDDWSRGEPDNYGNNEKCIAMNQSEYYLWGDANCELWFPFICGTRPVQIL